MKRVAEFCELKPEISGLSAGAITPLIRERDEEVRATAISTIEKSLNYHNPPGSKTKKNLTAKDIKVAIEKE